MLWAVASVDDGGACLHGFTSPISAKPSRPCATSTARLRVRQNHGYPGAMMRTLTNGTIQHGTQYFGTDELRQTPTTYYAEDSGVGLAMRSAARDAPRNIGVIGLGAGTIAAYGQPGRPHQFYEINPAVAPIAQNVFTYHPRLRAHSRHRRRRWRDSHSPQEDPAAIRCAGRRCLLGRRDSIAPADHAGVGALSKASRAGRVIAFHISNQHVDLEPPIALLAKAAGMKAMRVSSGPKDEIGEFGATWMLLTDNAAFLARPEVAAHAHAAADITGPEGLDGRLFESAAGPALVEGAGKKAGHTHPAQGFSSFTLIPRRSLTFRVTSVMPRDTAVCTPSGYPRLASDVRRTIRPTAAPWQHRFRECALQNCIPIRRPTRPGFSPHRNHCVPSPRLPSAIRPA